MSEFAVGGERRGIGVDAAYVAVIESRDGEEGWYMGIAKRGEPGYYQLKPGFGPWKSEADVRRVVDEANERLGLSKDEAMEIEVSSMRAQNQRDGGAR